MSTVLPALTLLKIPAGEEVLVGRLYTPQGEGPHPYVVLLHGFPGTELNLDIAALLQRQGFGVLVFNYRGAWGSQGSFSFEHALEDVHTALAYLRQPEVATEHRIDSERLALAGHSMGGFLACMAGSEDREIKAVASLSGFNFGLAANMLASQPEHQAAFAQMLEDEAFFLNGADSALLMEQFNRNAQEWNLIGRVMELIDRPLLLVGAEHDVDGPVSFHHDPLVQVLEEVGASHFKHHIIMETEHNYVGKRVEVAELLRDWLLRNL